MKKLATLFAILAATLMSSTVEAQQKSIVDTAVSAGNFNTLVTAVKAGGLVGALSGHDQLTVFAPTDEAFAKLDPALLQTLLKPENKGLLQTVLKYHVVAGRVNASTAYGLNEAKSLAGQRLNLNLRGDSPKINDSTIIATDIECTNGVIHVIDEVLIPSLDTIPVVATKAGTFNTLLAAAKAAGLADVLGSAGPFTVFAPSDDAFAKLPAGTVETLLQPENKQKLVDILKYHVIAGRVYDNDAVKAGQASTLLNRSVNIRFTAEGIMVNKSKVIAKNVAASNGVIHVIDNVLLPPSSMQPGEAMTVIMTAIERGAPTYNAGGHRECCNIYTSALNNLMGAGISGADQHTMSIISSTLTNAGQHHSDTDRAWALRRGMDQLYNRLGSMPRTMTAKPAVMPSLNGPVTYTNN